MDPILVLTLDDGIQTPQRSESVKKPKIKLVPSSTPKTNGTTSTPKASSKATESKSAKSKTTTDAPAEKEMSVPKEPEYTPEERHARKEVRIGSVKTSPFGRTNANNLRRRRYFSSATSSRRVSLRGIKSPRRRR